MVSKIKNTNKIKSNTLQTFVAFLAVLIFVVTPLANIKVAADQYQEQIDALRTVNEQKKQQQGILSVEASSLSEAISKLQQQIDASQARINQLNDDVAKLKQQIVETEAELAKQKDLLGQSIKAMYVNGEITTVEMLATSKDLSDYFDKQQYQDSVRSKIKTTLDKVTQLKLDLNTKKETVEKALAEQKVLQGQLASDRAEKDRVLNLNQGQQNALENEVKANSAQINELKRLQAEAYAAYLRKNSSSMSAGDPNKGGYPSAWANAPQDSLLDDWGMYNRECVSYAAWRVYQSGKFMPYWGGRGNAYEWIGNANAPGDSIYAERGVPATQTVAIWPQYYNNIGYYGHAAYVEHVYGDGSILVSQYNMVHGEYNEMIVPASTVSGLYFLHF